MFHIRDMERAADGYLLENCKDPVQQGIDGDDACKRAPSDQVCACKRDRSELNETERPRPAPSVSSATVAKFWEAPHGSELDYWTARVESCRRNRERMGGAHLGSPRIKVGAHYFSRDLRDDGIAVGAQLSHSGGYPIRRPHSSGETTTPLHPGCFCMLGASWFAVAVGVARKPLPESQVIRPDSESRELSRPEGVTDRFQIICSAIGPRTGRGNLLSKYNIGSRCGDETKPTGPEVAPPAKPFATPACCGGEGLAGAGAGPQGAVVSKSSQSSCKAPSADASEEVALRVSSEVGGLNIDNAPLVHVTGRDMAGSDQIAEPLRRVWVDLVVVGGHLPALRSGVRSAAELADQQGEGERDAEHHGDDQEDRIHASPLLTEKVADAADSLIVGDAERGDGGALDAMVGSNRGFGLLQALALFVVEGLRGAHAATCSGTASAPHATHP